MFHALRKTDFQKWQEFEFDEEWVLRLKAIAGLIPPNSNIFEFGTGPIGLRPFLDTSCRLISSDVIARNNVNVVIDLNRRPLPDLSEFKTEIGIFSGVLEYISDLRSLAKWVAQEFHIFIVTYESAPTRKGKLRSSLELFRRFHMGWVNHLTEVELIAIFSDQGFHLIQRLTWSDTDPEPIFVFRKTDARTITVEVP